MNIWLKKHINKSRNNRTEYYFNNFDFYDGNNFIAKILCQEYKMLSDEKIEGIYSTIIKLHKDSAEYNLIWHEDAGNFVYSKKQDKASLAELEQRLYFAVDKLNKLIEDAKQ